MKRIERPHHVNQALQEVLRHFAPGRQVLLLQQRENGLNEALHCDDGPGETTKEERATQN